MAGAEERPGRGHGANSGREIDYGGDIGGDIPFVPAAWRSKP